MSLTAEQRDLRDAVRGLLAKAEAGGAAWRRLRDEVGVAGLVIPERYGGAGAGLAEACVVMAELGRALTPAPMLGSSVLAARAVLATGDEAACGRLLPPIADGSVTAALAWTTQEGRWDVTEAAFTARAPGAGGAGDDAGADAFWELDGRAHYVLDGAASGVLLAVARTPGGLGLFELDLRGGGVTRAATAVMDDSRELAVVGLAAARGRRIGGEATGPLAAARDWACVALSAELAGAAQRALELTVEHMLTRVQFGQPIGGFQALQHRAADLHVLVESARSLWQAVAADGVAVSSPRAMAAKAYCSEVATQAASEMIQLHGAIGVTWEHQAHRYLKRAHGGRYLLGSPARQLAAIAASLIDESLIDESLAGEAGAVGPVVER
jgi:alkylation response protein AidB-like acyl-CoA dehydrogenase